MGSLKMGEKWIERDPGFLDRPPPRRRAAPPPDQESGQETQGDSLPAVAWVPVFCPRCHSRECPVNGKPPRLVTIRYHVCQSCGLSFKSFERNPYQAT